MLYFILPLCYSLFTVLVKVVLLNKIDQHLVVGQMTTESKEVVKTESECIVPKTKSYG